MHLTPPDLVLAAILLLAFPAWQLWRSLRTGERPRPAKLRGYLRTSAIISVLLAMLAAIWIAGGRSLASLGLDIPPSTGGLIGLAIAAAIVAALFVPTLLMKPRKEWLTLGADILPDTPAERAVFALMTLLIGAGWELLYRGFLLWALGPAVGLPFAIVAAAVAYGLAHGYKSQGQLAGSIAAALVFCIAYALTGSLWWLMIVHIAMPMVMPVARWRARRAEAQLTS